MSTLSEYVKSLEGTPKGEIADRLGISRPYLYGLLDETRSPSLPVAMRIAARTGGAVPITAWPKIAAVVEATDGAA